MTASGRAIRAAVLGLASAYLAAASAGSAAADPAPLTEVEIPAFARLYRTSCSTCHTAAPKLNVMGEAFRLNGYRFPENDQLLRKDDPVKLGAEPWKELWPRAIWPGEISDTPPIALRIQTEIVGGGDTGGDDQVEFRFPNELYLLAGANFGGSLGVFLETEWSPEEGVEVVQAKVLFQDLIPGLPSRSLNLWVGLQNPYLFTFTDRQIDRAAREKFYWQSFRYSDLELDGPGDEPIRSENEFGLADSQAALEVNGLAGGRLYYGLGLAQGAGGARENNQRKDLYYKFRYKIGGLRLDGKYPEGTDPVLGGGGQLQDRSLILEHFGYFGAEPVDDADDEHRSFGVNARLLWGRWDVGVGAIRSGNDDPWGFASGGIDSSTLFGKLEYMFFPWFIGSLKYDAMDIDVPTEVEELLLSSGLSRSRILPGAIFLIRQNIRAVVEGAVFTRYEGGSSTEAPWNIWLRLDMAF